jgi:hypothetical protein
MGIKKVIPKRSIPINNKNIFDLVHFFTMCVGISRCGRTERADRYGLRCRFFACDKNIGVFCEISKAIVLVDLVEGNSF